MRGILIAVFCLTAASAAAQTDDRDYLTAFLEDNLSGAGRKVTITGFEGALSSQAKIARLEIADDEGIWITLDNVVLDWSKSSLLKGEVVVNELSADLITIARLPLTDSGSLPSPEAMSFALPELPVSVDIGQVRAGRIVLDDAILGQPVEGTFEASMGLADGTGQIDLRLERDDADPDGIISLAAGFSNATGQLSVTLHAAEAAGGIASNLLGLPGEPSVNLDLSGDGTFDAFQAQFRLASDGVDRLSGPITIQQDPTGAHAFSAEFAGDPAPLFLPQYAAFLGDDVRLSLRGSRWPTGRVTLDSVQAGARALSLRGSLSVAGDGLPEAFDIDASIGLADGSPVLVPVPGPGETRLTSADLSLTFDAATDDAWTGALAVSGLVRDEFTIDALGVKGSGRIARTAGKRSFGATLSLSAKGAQFADPALQAALGSNLSGDTVLHWMDGQDALRIPTLDLRGEDYRARASLAIDGLAKAFLTTGWIVIEADDLGRFSALTGRPLSGSGRLRVEGEASRLTGAFDLALQADGQQIALGVASVDRLLATGPVRVTASARRDDGGTTLRNFDGAVGGLAVSATGKVSSHGSSLTGTVNLADLGVVVPGAGGALAMDGTFSGTLAAGEIVLSGKGQRLRFGTAEIDKLLSGSLDLDAAIEVRDGAVLPRSVRVAGANVSGSALRTGASDSTLQVDARLRDLALIAPQFPGVVTGKGTLRPTSTGFDANVRVTGPGSIDARVLGLVGAGTSDLDISGTASAAVLNGILDPVAVSGLLRYDLVLRGPLALSSASGRVTLSGGRIADPGHGLSLVRTEALVNLAGGAATVSATADAAAGGRLRLGGTVGLMAPNTGSLELSLDRLRLRDPELYDTAASSTLTISGPVLGNALVSGTVSLSETEVRVPSSGFSTAAEIDAISHVRDTADVRETRRRAGQDGAAGARSAAARGGPDYRLDIDVRAPNRIFVRGRGLDAELGGSVRLGGSLRQIVPSGAISLIRGRLDLLGKRLLLSEASLTLEGDLVPFLRVIASNETDGVTSTVTIEGPANAPDIIFSSVPELPQEEVLSWLLFGRGLDTISALQAAQLANAIAVLAGKGGSGIIDKLRQSFGFDDLDVSTSADGTATLRAGKYISDKVYTEIGVDQTGKTRLNLNLDVRDGVTIKGRVDSDGDSGIGIFLERDY